MHELNFKLVKKLMFYLCTRIEVLGKRERGKIESAICNNCNRLFEITNLTLYQ